MKPEVNTREEYFPMGEPGNKTKSESVFDKRGRMRWSLPGNTPEQNLQLGINNIQALFFAAFPEFNDLFPLDEQGKIEEDKREEAKAYILERVGTQEKYNKHITKSSLASNVTPYFGGSLLILLDKSFAPLGIDFELRIIDKQTKKYIDPEGTTWVTLQFLKDEFGVDYRTLNRSLVNTSTVAGFGQNGHAVILYNEAEARGRLQKFKELDKLPAPHERGIGYIEVDGERWVSLKYLVNEYGKSQPFFKSFLQDVATINGKASNGHKELFYNETEAKTKVQEFYTLPTLDPDTQKYKDREGRTLANLTRLAKERDVSPTTLRSYLSDIQVFKGRSIRGNEVFLYDEEEVIAKLKNSNFDNRAKPKSKDYWTPQIIEEEARAVWFAEGGLTQKLLSRIGREDLSGAISHKYPGGMVKLKEALGIEMEQRIPRSYWTPEKIEQHALEVLQKEGKIGHTLLWKLKMRGLSYAISNFYPGGMKALKEKIAPLPERKVVKVPVSPAHANDLLQAIFDAATKQEQAD